VLADHALVELLLHAHQLRGLGLGQLEDRDAGPHRDDVGDLLLADRRALGRLAGLPLVGQLALLLGQPALLVAQVRGLLELLGLDRGFLGPPGLLDLVLELAVDGGEVIDLIRIRDAASSIRSIALSGRKRSEM
jgi:hypothetical protein